VANLMHPSKAVSCAPEAALPDWAKGTLHSLGASLQLTPLHLPARGADLGLGHPFFALLFLIHFAGPAQPFTCVHCNLLWILCRCAVLHIMFVHCPAAKCTCSAPELFCLANSPLLEAVLIGALLLVAGMSILTCFVLHSAGF